VLLLLSLTGCVGRPTAATVTNGQSFTEAACTNTPVGSACLGTCNAGFGGEPKYQVQCLADPNSPTGGSFAPTAEGSCRSGVCMVNMPLRPTAGPAKRGLKSSVLLQRVSKLFERAAPRHLLPNKPCNFNLPAIRIISLTTSCSLLTETCPQTWCACHMALPPRP
jgi:hypothetical protein